MNSIESLGLLVVLVGACLSLGRRLFRKWEVEFDSRWEKFAYSAAVGFGALAYVTFFLAALGLLYRWVAFLALAVLTALAAADWRSWGAPVRDLSPIRWLRFSLGNKMVVTLILLFISMNLVATLAPPVDWDSLMYHLEAPKRYIQQHRLVYLPNAYTNFPQYMEMIYTFAMLLHSDTLARLVNLMMGLFVLSAMHAFSKRHTAQGNFLSLAIFYCAPLVSVASIETFVDLGLTFYQLCAFFAFYNWMSSAERKWLHLAAMMCGIALSIKYTAIIVSLLLNAVIVVESLHSRKRLQQVVALLATFNLISLSMIVPWLAKNYIFTGDPIFPILSGLLGGWGRGLASANRYLYGEGYGLADYLLLPWQMTFSPRFGFPWPGPIFLIFLPIPFFTRGLHRAIKFLALCVVTLFLFWSMSAGQSVRFFLPGLALLSLVLGHSVKRLTANRVLLRQLVYFCLLLVSGLNIITGPLSYALMAAPVVFGRLSRESYLAQHLEIYAVADYCNSRLPSEAQIISVWEERGYYFDRPLVIGQSPEGAFLHRFHDIAEAPQLLGQLKEAGISHLLINADLINDCEFNLRDRYMYNTTTRSLLIYKQDFKRQYLRLLYQTNGISLYEIEFNGR